MQACDLKSTVSEHAKNAGHSINWASVKIIGQENHLLSRKIHEAINIHTQQLEMNRDQGYNHPPLYGTILQPHSFKTRLRITANVITDERILFLLRNNYVGFLQQLFSSLFD